MQWLDAETDALLWEVHADRGRVDRSSTPYGVPPPGVTQTAPAPLDGVHLLQVVYRAPGEDPLSGTFELAEVRPDSVLRPAADNPREPLSAWSRCST
jgi:hypothetical protein